MSDDEITLGTLFDVDEEDVTRGVLEAADDAMWTRLGLPDRLRQAAAGRVAKRMSALLDVPLADVMGRAWSTLREVREHADPTRFPPGQDSEVALAGYTVESEHVPRIELRVLGARPAALKFPVTVSLMFEGGKVVIRDARIRALRTGACTVTGRVCCETIELKKLTSKPLDLPGELSIREPIPIRPLPRASG